MKRIEGIEALRLVMAFTVVLLHSIPESFGPEFEPVKMICRAAVPFFLLASGYFLKSFNSIDKDIFFRPLIKLAPIYVFWMIVYYLVAFATGSEWIPLNAHALLSGGLAYHLWYLPASGFAIVAVSFGLATVGLRATAAVCAVFALAAFATGPYHDVLGLPGEPRRGGLFVAPSYVCTGYLIAQ